MSYEIYRGIFWGGIAGTVLFGITAIVLFFVFRIPETVGILSGRTAGKAIELIRRRQAGEGNERMPAGDYTPLEVPASDGTAILPVFREEDGTILLSEMQESDGTVILPDE